MLLLFFVFIITLVLCFFILYFQASIKYASPTPHFTRHVKVSFFDFISNVGTGDLIFLSGKTYGENMMKTYTQCPFSHLGIIVKEFDADDGQNYIYIWETDIGQRAKTGARVIHLNDKMNLWKGWRILGWKKLITDTPISSEHINRIVKRYIDADLDKLLLPHFFGPLFKQQEQMFCSELVAQTLVDLKILDDDREAYEYSPVDFYRQFKTTRGYIYSELKLVYF